MEDLKSIIDEKMSEFIELSQMVESLGFCEDLENWNVGDNEAMISFLRKSSEVYGILNAYTRIYDDDIYANLEKEIRERVEGLQDALTKYMNDLASKVE